MTEKNKSIRNFPNSGNVPKLRFSEFIEKWEELTIKDVLKIGSGKDYKHLQKGDIPVFGTGGLMTTVNNYLYDGETVCIGRKGTINKPFYFEGKLWTVDTLFYTHSFKNVIPKFVFNIFQQINWLQYNEASGVPSLSKSTIEKVQIFIPSISEQQKISSLLSLIDERIELSMKIITKVKSQMQFLEDVLLNGKLRLKDDDGNPFNNWSQEKLSNIGKTYNGLSGKTKEDFGSGEKYIQYKQIFDSSKIKLSNCALVSISENENQNTVQFGDIFFTVSSETPEEIGMSSVLLENVENVFLNSFCFGFRTHSFEKLIPEFSQFFFRSKVFRNEIVKLAQGSTRYNISKSEFLKLKVILPSKEEQIKIANTLSSVNEKIETEKKILTKYETQKKYLLANLFV